MTILDDIVTYKQSLLNEGYYDELLQRLPSVSVQHKGTLVDSVTQNERLDIIAEIKSKSPSVSDIPTRDLMTQVTAYTEAGASAISILTDERYFGGSFERLAELTQHTHLPVLCKDFIIHHKQIDVAHHVGASIILLIVHILTDDALETLYQYARHKGLEVIVEVHDREELARALRIRPTFIGVNNRDLRTFQTDVQHTVKVLAGQQDVEGVHYISESGIRTSEDVESLICAGIDGVLVGETLMKASDVTETLQSLRGYKEKRRCT
ncbi:indole-3-glycerol phosphate synthase TrpC [Staphylococcus sp. 17KM0847]|uniref:indole-3-glycerol phosphate synthase TrpC n=1 Tax=Staphylococcus sp. 17KM0847 TaxID=2583989 RepID=UPI0015DC14EC|nr:indole-3-glycerol phosphate synthase TrpC [Staphylococcus sp. 17KM0847]QLK86783.1 indole-3-glycerol phosphate synthase TrpC [Staphylococcus sp. 17KM0847]